MNAVPNRETGDRDRPLDLHQLPDQVCQELNLSSGATLVMMDYQPKSRMQITYDADTSPVSFGFTLSMQSRSRLVTNTGRTVEICHPDLGTEISFTPKTRGRAWIEPVRPVRSVCLTLPASLLANVMGNDADAYPAVLRRIADGAGPEHFRRVSPMGPQMQAIVSQMLDCRFQGQLRRIYLEAKAMELLSCRLQELIRPGNGPACRCGDHDARLIRKAARLIQKDLKHPPGLAELARQAGINQTKLKQGFKAVYGTTVYQHLRALRFERAADLLAQSPMSVAEVASAVGYSDIKHFYESFRRQFGTTPGVYRKQI